MICLDAAYEILKEASRCYRKMPSEHVGRAFASTDLLIINRRGNSTTRSGLTG
jgi:hypothetical protein